MKKLYKLISVLLAAVILISGLAVSASAMVAEVKPANPALYGRQVGAVSGAGWAELARNVQAATAKWGEAGNDYIKEYLGLIGVTYQKVEKKSNVLTGLTVYVITLDAGHAIVCFPGMGNILTDPMDLFGAINMGFFNILPIPTAKEITRLWEMAVDLVTEEKTKVTPAGNTLTIPSLQAADAINLVNALPQSYVTVIGYSLGGYSAGFTKLSNPGKVKEGWLFNTPGVNPVDAAYLSGSKAASLSNLHYVNSVGDIVHLFGVQPVKAQNVVVVPNTSGIWPMHNINHLSEAMRGK
ncbi:MAG: hypothetical protein LBR73_07715 [Oscillospiraceae bacterium]|nr:hypothetical protein [Oscillospiraceae bacterium]